MNKPDVVIYHDPCIDGFTSAWVYYRKFENNPPKLLPAQHDKNKDKEDFWVQECSGKHVVVVDFAFSRDLTEKLHEVSASFRVLDHHASNEKILNDLDYCYFNQEVCGSWLAWEDCFDTPVPNLVKYVNNQDLWKWELPSGKGIFSLISMLPKTMNAWEKMHNLLEDKEKFATQAAIGDAVYSKEYSISEEIASAAEEWEIFGYPVKAVNCPYLLRSLVCDIIGTKEQLPFVAAYSIDNGNVTWSLRSNHGEVDVSALASKVPGGGGHPKSSGFTIPIAEVDFINRKLG